MPSKEIEIKVHRYFNFPTEKKRPKSEFNKMEKIIGIMKLNKE